MSTVMPAHTPLPYPVHPPLRTVVLTVALLAAGVLGQYCRQQALVPLGAGLGLLALFRLTPVRPPAFHYTLAVILAQALWFLAGCLQHGTWTTGGFDMSVMFLAAAALWLRPGRPAATFVGVWQTLSLLTNLIALESFAWGQPPHRTLIMHCALRVLSLACLMVEAQLWERHRAARC
jgi:hypothetical protein